MVYKFPINPYMSTITAPEYVNRQIREGKDRGYYDFLIDLEDDIRTFPNICVPIAALIDYYRTNEDLTFDFKFRQGRSYSELTAIHCPIVIEDNLCATELNNPLDRVWRFGTPEGIGTLVDRFAQYVSEFAHLGHGVLNSIQWCMNEIMDNVLLHSEAPYGFVMGQIHRNNNRFVISIFDWGIGIYNSLRASKHRPTSPIDAITCALRASVTRDDSLGQGNGMWGLSELIRLNEGTVRIDSAGARYICENNEIDLSKFNTLQISQENGTTLVDFQLDYSKPADVELALYGHKPVDLWAESFELETGECHLSVAKHAHGTGTRKSAEMLKNLLLNIHSEERKSVTIDFSGVNVVSSSFADEFIGKLVSEYGFSWFNRNFVLAGMSEFVSGIIDRSIEQRIAQKHSVPDNLNHDNDPTWEHYP